MKSIRFRFVLLFLSTSAAFAQNTVTLLPIADSYVRSGPEKENVRFGAFKTLAVKLSASPTDGFHRESYLKFDLSGVSNITSGKLRLNCPDPDEFAAGTLEIRSSSGTDWTDDRSEKAITWANRPPAGKTVHATGTWALGWNEWDLTSFLKAEKAAGRNVVTLIARNTTVTKGLCQMNSRESPENRPELQIVSAPPKP